MPEAERLLAAADGGVLKGGAPRAVWLVLHADPMTVSARAAGERLIELGGPPPLGWTPLSGDAAQLTPVVGAGGALGWPGAPHRAQEQAWLPDPAWNPEPGWGEDPDWALNTGWTHGADWTQGAGWPHGRGRLQRPARAGRLPGEPRAPAARDGLPGVNNEGRVCVQIGVIGHAWTPFTTGPVQRAREIVSWLDSGHVARGWPAGDPPPFPA